ncbi:hypothetical protein P7C73_g566, partial [Tremellales sp. Uapishka_1]
METLNAKAEVASNPRSVDSTMPTLPPSIRTAPSQSFEALTDPHRRISAPRQPLTSSDRTIIFLRGRVAKLMAENARHVEKNAENVETIKRHVEANAEQAKAIGRYVEANAGQAVTIIRQVVALERAGVNTIHASGTVAREEDPILRAPMSSDRSTMTVKAPSGSLTRPAEELAHIAIPSRSQTIQKMGAEKLENGECREGTNATYSWSQTNQDLKSNILELEKSTEKLQAKVLELERAESLLKNKLWKKDMEVETLFDNIQEMTDQLEVAKKTAERRSSGFYLAQLEGGSDVKKLKGMVTKRKVKGDIGADIVNRLRVGKKKVKQE